MATTTENLRAQITALDAKLDAAKMPDMKKRLDLALSSLGNFEETGEALFLQRAIEIYNAALQGIGNRPPEMLEEMPR
jgi:hypothetical protein